MGTERSVVTSPATTVEVRCECGHTFTTTYRPSINLTLGEEWTEERIRSATTAACPRCGAVIELGSLIVER